jgi:hypothetical protein
MNALRKVAVLLILSITFSFLNSCSNCDNEKPRARVSNMSSEDVSVQIKTTGGNTENINNIESGKSSEYRSYDPGLITFTIALKDLEDVVNVVEMDFCSDYEIIINKDNSIIATSTDID